MSSVNVCSVMVRGSPPRPPGCAGRCQCPGHAGRRAMSGNDGPQAMGTGHCGQCRVWPRHTIPGIRILFCANPRNPLNWFAQKVFVGSSRVPNGPKHYSWEYDTLFGKLPPPPTAASLPSPRDRVGGSPCPESCICASPTPTNPNPLQLTHSLQ